MLFSEGTKGTEKTMLVPVPLANSEKEFAPWLRATSVPPCELTRTYANDIND